MKKLHALLLVLTLCVSVLMRTPSGYAAENAEKEKLKNRPARAEQFMDWGLGLFIHWSMDSQLGCVISHSMVGASDDYLDRFINELPKSFNPQEYDPDKWMKIARLAGVKYVVFTAKHHSGFCMWDTDTTDFKITNTPYGKDIVRQYVKACRKYGLKVGFYFSPDDFHFLHQQGHLIRRRVPYCYVKNNTELRRYDMKQVKELFTEYGPVDVCFIDGSGAEALVQQIHRLQPDCLVTRGEMPTPEQKIPEPMPGPWESCFTMGTQWHYKPTNEDYKSGMKLIEMLIETRAKGGNLLINMGPKPDGTIPFEQERRLRELALWMFINGEAIHGIRPCPEMREGDLWFTRKGDTAYVFLTGEKDWSLGERREFELKTLRATSDTEISVLGQNSKVVEYHPEANPEARFSQKDNVLQLSVVRAQRIYNNRKWPNPVVVKLENVKFIDD